MCTAPQTRILTTAALQRAGMTRAAVERALRTGALVRIRRGLFRRGELCAMIHTAVEHGGALGCVSAARHLGLWTLGDEDDVHVSLRPGGHRLHEGCACVPHWDDTTSSGGTGIVRVPQLLRQILFCQGLTGFFVTLESARRKHRIDHAGLAWLRGHTNAEARDAIDFSRDDADSGIESVFRWRLRDLAPVIRCQVRVTGVGRVDFLIGDRLIIEIDGRVNHAGHDLRHKDLVRDASSAAWGYLALRFDYALVMHDWQTVEAAVRGLIETGAHMR